MPAVIAAVGAAAVVTVVAIHLVELSLQTAAVLGALTAVSVAGRMVWKARRKLNWFLDDWAGETAHSGNLARPGVIERLRRIEDQVHPNHGTSLADQIDRIEQSAEYVGGLAHDNNKKLTALSNEFVEHLALYHQHLGWHQETQDDIDEADSHP